MPNYLPQGTVCDATDAGITLGVCEIAKCDGNNECKATNLDQGTGCFIGNNVQCENAGTCGPDPAVVIATPDDTYVCNSIECPPEPPVTGCNDRPDRGSLGQPCEISGGDEGICCVDPASGSDPKELKCVRKRSAPVCLTITTRSAPPIKSAATKVTHSGIQITSFAKKPVTRFHVPPIRAFSEAVRTLNSRLLTAQMVAGQDKAEGKNKDASIRAPHVQPAMLWQTTVTTSTVPQIRAADQTHTAKI